MAEAATPRRQQAPLFHDLVNFVFLLGLVRGTFSTPGDMRVADSALFSAAEKQRGGNGKLFSPGLSSSPFFFFFPRRHVGGLINKCVKVKAP